MSSRPGHAMPGILLSAARNVRAKSRVRFMRDIPSVAHWWRAMSKDAKKI